MKIAVVPKLFFGGAFFGQNSVMVLCHEYYEKYTYKSTLILIDR